MMRNEEQIGRALDRLNQVLRPFVRQRLETFYPRAWANKVAEAIPSHQEHVAFTDEATWDTQTLMLILRRYWYSIFNDVLGQANNSLLNKIYAVRNRWAHQVPFSDSETRRAISAINQLLESLPTSDKVKIVWRENKGKIAREWLKQELADHQPHKTVDLHARARQQKIAIRTLQRASAVLHVEKLATLEQGRFKEWFWLLPEEPTREKPGPKHYVVNSCGQNIRK